MYHKLEEWQPMAANRAAFILRHDRWHITNEMPIPLSKADPCPCRQAKERWIVGSEIHTAEVAEHQR